MDADARAAQIRELAQSTDWSGGVGKFVLHHLLAVVTWPASVAAAASAAAPEGYPLSLAVGSVWDAVNEKPHKLRAMANLWTSWAGRHVLAPAYAPYLSWRRVDAPAYLSPCIFRLSDYRLSLVSPIARGHSAKPNKFRTRNPGRG